VYNCFLRLNRQIACPGGSTAFALLPVSAKQNLPGYKKQREGRITGLVEWGQAPQISDFGGAELLRLEPTESRQSLNSVLPDPCHKKK
jgi:hypothetical protein